jgi:hypothetical protein
LFYDNVSHADSYNILGANIYFYYFNLSMFFK